MKDTESLQGAENEANENMTTNVFETQQRVNNQVLEESKVVPREIISRAQAKLDQTKLMQTEIKKDMANISELFRKLRLKISLNHKTCEYGAAVQQNLNVLMQTKSDYLNHLLFETKPIEDLLKLDIVHWEENLEAAKEEAARIEADVKYMLEKSQIELQGVLEG